MTPPPPPEPPEPPEDPADLDPSFRDLEESYLAAGNLQADITEAVCLAEAEGIRWGFWPFPYPFQGIYLYRGAHKPPLIGIADRLIRLPVLARSVFYEELGHHFMSVPYGLPYRFHSQTQRLAYSKMEKQALRWAALKLIPRAALIAFAAAGGGTVRDLARQARVTDEIAAERIDALRAYDPALYRRLLLLSAGEEG
jgi:hypothetical protein